MMDGKSYVIAKNIPVEDDVRLPMSVTHVVCTGLLIFVLATNSTLAANIDQDLLKIEQVELRLQSIPDLVQDDIKELAESELKEIIRKIYNPAQITADLAKRLEQTKKTTISPETVEKAVAAFLQSRSHLDAIYENSDQQAADRLQARLTIPNVGSEIEKLSTSMVSPELVRETALIRQVIFFQCKSTDGNLQLKQLQELAKAERKAALARAINMLRNSSVNEQPSSKTDAVLAELAQGRSTLAGLTQPDLETLLAFLFQRGRQGEARHFAASLPVCLGPSQPSASRLVHG
ncbi:hypothetical protein MUU53_20355 [Rhizobium lemnae]|uniref:Uncharacterized protein n=1 Tax=Rhizobium lemnae TaxID=1214924 RepID=A0ABV8EEE8_9HYPH|nr:hypothetical protein [Rhizobium lemnae]MCJ8510242.1 hypothetical protein [Rhizobium lemnae]